MADNRLLLDIGNTRIKWCHSRDGQLRLGTADGGDIDEFREHCERFHDGKPERIMISTVARVPTVHAAYDICMETWGVEPEFLQSQTSQGGVENAYENPRQLGVDRWLALVGAAKEYGKPVVVWDLGTATTLDAVDSGGKHIGGWILPGPSTMLKSLSVRTQLDVPDKMDPEEQGTVVPPGKNTEQCIAWGVYAAQKGALNQFLKNFEPGATKPKIVVTGGHAGPMQEYLGHVVITDAFLVFRGMMVED